MSDLTIYRTDYLYPNPSFLFGMGSIFNLEGGYVKFNSSPSPEEADFNAIRNDWFLVGNDLNFAINKFKSQEGLANVEKSTASAK